MSLVAYGTSDESTDDESDAQDNETVSEVLPRNTNQALKLPAPKEDAGDAPNSDWGNVKTDLVEPALFRNLPKPRNTCTGSNDVVEEDDVIPPNDEAEPMIEKPTRKSRGPVKIALPSLSQFKDIEDEEQEKKRNRVKPSERGTGLFSILPPPRGTISKETAKNLIPHVLTKKPTESKSLLPQQHKNTKVESSSTVDKLSTVKLPLNYDDSDTDEEGNVDSTQNERNKNVDFFSLSEAIKLPESTKRSSLDFFSLSDDVPKFPEVDEIGTNTVGDKNVVDIPQKHEISHQGEQIVASQYNVRMLKTNSSDKILISNVINLPKEEIKLKNKAEVGPKLPVPEQEYNIDSQGNVAFDEKAIEYLCGKRGVKRKDKDFDEANIIEISGEDIKPDEREWLVKALTEEAVERPVSMHSAGPSSQSKKKHQITYLAHQAKAMEVELKNQWAQNRMTRKQTQSKYGF